MAMTGRRKRVLHQSSLHFNSKENNRLEWCFLSTLPCSWQINKSQINIILWYLCICNVKGSPGQGGRIRWGGLRNGALVSVKLGSCIFKGRRQHRTFGRQHKSKRGLWQEKNSGCFIFCRKPFSEIECLF